MDTTILESPREFLETVRPALEQAEATNNLMYGLALRRLA